MTSDDRIMALEHYKSKKKGKPKRTSKLSASKSRMLAIAKGWKPVTSPKLIEIYSAKTEWLKKAIPKLTE